MKAGRQLASAQPWSLVAAFSLLAILIVVLVSTLFTVLEQRQREREYKQLSAMVQLKAGEIESWLADRRRDAEALAASPGLRDDARSMIEHPDPVTAGRLKRQIEGSRAAAEARSIEVLNREDRPVLVVGPPLDGKEAIPAWPRGGSETPRAFHVDLHRNGSEGMIHLAFLVAITDGEAPIGYLRLNISPLRKLYPLLRRWPLPGNSGETLLVRREGEELLVLSEARYRDDAALSLRLPLASLSAPAAPAMRWSEDAFGGVDYRQVPILGAMRPVAGTPWMLLAKEDEAEALADLHHLRAVSFAVLLTAVLFGAMLWWQVWRRQTLQARQDLESQLAAIAAAIPGALCSFRRRPDSSTSFTYATSAIAKLCGLAPAHLAKDAAPFFAMIHSGDRKRIDASTAASARGLTHWHEEFRLIHPVRGEIWIEGRFTPQRQADGGTLWHGYLQDVSARRRGEEALREAEERYRSLLGNIPGAAFRCEIGPPSRIVFLSDGVEAITGHRAADLLRPGGAHWGSDVVVAEDKPLIRAAVERAIAGRSPYQVEYRVRRADGGIRWLYEKGRPVFGDDDKAQWLDGVIVDISARVEAETALQASRERWRQLAEAMPQLVWTCLPDGSCDYVNQHWSEYTGRPADEPLGHSWLAVVHPEDRGRLAAAWSRAVADEAAFDGEYRLRRRDGEYRWFKTRALPVRDAANHLVKWYGSNTDIEELKEFEEALHHSLLRHQGLHQLDRAILEASTPEEVASKGLAHLGALLSFRYGNARIFDFAAGTATVLALQSSEGWQYEPQQQVDLAEFGLADLAALQEGRVCIGRDIAAIPERPLFLDHLYQQGIRSYVRLPLIAEGRLVGSLNLVSDQPGYFDHCEVEIARPVADVLAIALQQAFLRQHLVNQAAMLEERVAQRTAELARMKDRAEAASRAKSQFLANMSHELRTPLNSLLILSQLLADNAQANLTPQQVGFARVINDAGNDLLSLINDILDLAKIESGRAVVKTEEVPIRTLLDYIERIFRPLAANKGLQLELDVAPELPECLISDPDHLRPILRNLVANAVKFTPEGSVGLHVRRAEAGWNPANPVLSRAAAVLAFAVVDTGIGIAAEKLPLIFEAFEQADAGGPRRFGGTGLGLHIARTNAELLGGELQAESTAGRGSVFTLFLPLRYAGPAGMSAAPASARAARAARPARKALIAEPDSSPA